MLETELQIFRGHLPEWLQSHPSEYALVKGDVVIGFFDTVDRALEEGARRFGLESFLVRQVEPQEPEIFIPALALNLLHAGS